MSNRRIDEYYAPVFAWCRRCVAAFERRPVFIGISGPQGSGKSSLSHHLVHSFEAESVRAVSISIDDFYLTFDEQRSLASRYPTNRTLELRGYPGTHDVELGVRTLESLRNKRPTAIPRYDKSAHQGRGDRLPESAWSMVAPRIEEGVDAAVDLVIVEGWMLGFRPITATEVDAIDPSLAAPNEFLAAYDAWDSFLDAFILLDATSLDDIVTWRVDSERARRERGETALSDADARDYIERFLPAYRAYVPALRARPIGSRGLYLVLDSDRHPTSIRER
ncbi:MAG: hypothetical protein U0165_06670 [Polyangiaceae bacterium]